MKPAVTRMSLCVLGSGSAGNCTVVALHRAGRKRPYVILIDAGLSIRQTEQRLAQMGLALNSVRELLLTHFDRDHFQDVWVRRAARLRWKVRFHIDHWGRANRYGAPELEHEAFDGPFEPVPGCRIHPVRLAHDRAGTIGYRIDTAAGRIGFATDLGRVNGDLIDLFSDLDVLAIESNYCPQLQLDSDRPIFLKHRIMGGRGHLSNEQSLEAVRLIQRQSPRLRRVVALHLSRQCNHPRRIEALYGREEPDLAPLLVLSNQLRPTPWLHVSQDPRTGTLWSGHLESDAGPRDPFVCTASVGGTPAAR